MDDDNLRYFSDNLNSICNQIHTLIRDKVRDSTVDESKWRFMEFLATKGKGEDLTLFMKVLKDVERNFSSIIDTMSLLGENEGKGELRLSPTLISIVGVMEPRNIDRAMSKLREAIRIMRNNRLSVFSQLSEY